MSNQEEDERIERKYRIKLMCNKEEDERIERK